MEVNKLLGLWVTSISQEKDRKDPSLWRMGPVLEHMDPGCPVSLCFPIHEDTRIVHLLRETEARYWTRFMLGLVSFEWTQPGVAAARSG